MSPTPQDDAVDDLAERLADWLASLHLIEHLPAAGLPRLERDGSGRATWIDPETEGVLDASRLRDFDRLLRQQGSELEHAVPIPLLQLARQARLREHLVTTPWFTYAALAELRGTTIEATRFAVHKAAGENRLLVIPSDSAVMVPGFQLDAFGAVRAELIDVLEPILSAGMEPWRAWVWLTQPAALLGGLVPQEAAADPVDADVVRKAAVVLAERVRAS